MAEVSLFAALRLFPFSIHHIFCVQFRIVEGHSGINLIPIDPLHIPSIGIKQGEESPVNIELKFNEVDLIGLSDVQFTKIK